MIVVGYYCKNIPNLFFIESLPQHPFLNLMLQDEFSKINNCRKNEIEIVDIRVLKINK